jgi:hypothetical protein
VLRLPDARSGGYAEVRSGRPGLLRVSAHLRPETAERDWTGVRVLLIADLLARAAELRGVQVLTAVVFPGEPPEESAYAERAAGLLGIHPPEARAGSAEVSAVPGGMVDVHIAGPGSADDQLRGLLTLAGAVCWLTAGPGEGSSGAGGAMPAAADPLAIRLALMSHSHDHAVDLDDGMLARASQTTERWRDQVADWAESPSSPMPSRVRTALDAAFGDLDTRRALQLLTGWRLKPACRTAPGSRRSHSLTVSWAWNWRVRSAARAGEQRHLGG